ncbi:MAG: SpoIIE family protein phosphatase [Candidatus Riflebacteria bacterium]|nr:SpoIIE family protein phosphatase [Candidatus Riflebacteria bacterium]
MKTTLKKILYWLAFMLCFSGIPALLTVYGFLYLHNQHQQISIVRHQTELNRFFKTLQPAANGESFWCNYLTKNLNNEVISNKDQASEVIEKIVKLRRNLRFNYVVYNDKDGVATTSVPLEPAEDCRLTLVMIWKILHGNSKEVTEFEQQAAGRTIGPQLNWGHLLESSNYLTWTDSTLEKPLIWAKMVHKHLVVILIEPTELDSYDGIWNFLKDFSEKSGGVYDFAMIEHNKDFRCSDTLREFESQVQQAFTEYGQEKSSLIQTTNLLAFPRFIKSDLTICGYINKSQISDNRLWLPGFILGLLLTFVFIAIGRYSHRLIIREEPDSLSLRWKLRFLFFFANGLPLLVLFFIGTDYLNQKRDNLLRETHGSGISFLQDFDEKIEIEFAKTMVAKKKAEKNLLLRLTTEKLNDDNFMEFIHQLGPQVWDVALVASKSDLIGTKVGLMDEDRGIVPQSVKDGGKSSKTQNDFLRKIGHFFLNRINGDKIPEKIATEIELLIESITQKPLSNFTHTLLVKRGHFLQWGFGNDIHPAIVDTFSRVNSTNADYFFLLTFRRIDFQHAFLKKQLSQANRNHLGMKIFALSDIRWSLPQKSYSSSVLREYSSTLTTYPEKELKIIHYDSQDYLAMGFTGKFISDYQLIGLYPVENIDVLINKQKRQLLIFAILSLLMTFGLSQVLAQGFLMPLQVITAGAKAIENKHFEHRLPELGRDEFGAMGQIFNNVMVDLEELSVASAIQEQLLPQTSIETGNFSLFGRSVSMAELGGDYYDYLALDNHKFSVLLGDVAGHGVGAALIMAMAKAGIIQLDHLLNQPLALITELHDLILASKTKKQKKIMTFQYLCLDGLTGRGRYSNAGACSPIMIRENASVAEELTLAGAALGAFKKANFSEIEVVFSPGDAMIFYTDGIVEARNSAGDELSYEHLKELLKSCWDQDAETYYNNIFRAYMQHIGNEGAQDDLTMVVLVFNGSQKGTYLPMEINENHS